MSPSIAGPDHDPVDELRVVVVIGNLRADGAQVSTLALAAALPRHGVRPVLVALEDVEPSLVPGARAAGIDVRVLRSRSRPRWTVELTRMLRSEQPDVVHTVLAFADLVGQTAGRLAGAPVVTSFVDRFTYTARDGSWHGEAGTARARLTSRVARASTRRLVARHHAVSGDTARVNAAALGLDPTAITVVARGRSPGVELTDRERADLRSSLGVGPSGALVMAAARLAPSKGFEQLVAAAAVLRDRPGLVVAVAGRDDGAGAALARLVRAHGLEGRVRFLGHRNDVPQLLAAADLYVQVSRSEAGLATAIEAFAAGVPALLPAFQAREGVAVDRVHAAFVDPDDTDALAAAIADALDDPVSARARAEAAAELFTTHFTIDVAAAGMAELYRSVAQEHQARRRPAGHGDVVSDFPAVSDRGR